MPDYPDTELVNMVCEDSEDARDVLYERYVSIVDYLIHKYRNIAKALNLDAQEVRQEALLGFSNALANYNQNRDTTLSTFITLCVERRIRNYIRRSDTLKHKTFIGMYSLDAPIDAENSTLKDVLGDTKYDPQKLLDDKEVFTRLKKEAIDILSPTEREVFELLINGFNYEDISSILKCNRKQLYNYINRIREKLKGIVK